MTVQNLYLIYKIKNLINGKIYVGKHKTTDENDSYMGSGKLIKNAVRKYGRENFKKDILFCAFSWADASSIEYEFINSYNHCELYNLVLSSPECDKKIKSDYVEPASKIGMVPCYSLEAKTGVLVQRSEFIKNRDLYTTHAQGKRKSKEVREKISKSNKGKIRTRESIEKTKIKLTGRTRTKSERKSISKAKRRLYKFKTPCGKFLTFYGSLTAFCELHDLSLDRLRKFIKKDIELIIPEPTRKDSTQKCRNLTGWTVYA